MIESALPPLSLFEGTCDLCDAQDVQVARFRVEQVKAGSERSVSRTALLCVTCRAPLMSMLKLIPQKQSRGPLPTAEIKDLIETPLMRVQRIGVKAAAAEAKRDLRAKSRERNA